MKIILIVLLVTTGLSSKVLAQKYSTDTGIINFYSKAPVADVDATNKKVKVELKPSSGGDEVTFEIKMHDFEFKNGKMGRDAEKKYLEIDNYPRASFKGKITGKINYDKPGTYDAAAEGKLTIHGVEKDVSEKGKVVVDKEGVKLQCEFSVKLADYKIDRPEILSKKMTEDNVKISVDATLSEGGGKDSASKKKDK